MTKKAPDVADFPDGQNDWIKYTNLDERTRRLMFRRSNKARAAFSICLIVIGVLLFLGNLGVLPVRDIWAYWPAILVTIGVSHAVGAETAASRLAGILVAVFGAFFLLTNLGLVHLRMRDSSWPLSLLLIVGGVIALLNVLNSSGRNAELQGETPQTVPQLTLEDSVSDFVVAGAVKRNVTSSAFRGGTATTILGNIEIDLRHAQIPMTSRSILNVQAIFGATKIRVPQTWRIHVNGAGILGNFEDKTIPPNTGPDAPTLVITGYSIFSAVEIES